MTLVRWKPFHDGETGQWAPVVDVFEKGDDLFIRAELPGVNADDIDVRVEKNTLILSGKRKKDEELLTGKSYRRERSYGEFVRRFGLPTTVDPSGIAAKHVNGVLEIVLPKSEAARPRKIEIAAA